MCGIAGSSAISKDCGKRGKRLSCFPRFPSGRHFHRFCGHAFGFWDVIWPIDSRRRFFLYPPLSLLVMILGRCLVSCCAFTVVRACRKPLVLDDGCVAHALVFAENTIGKRVSFPTHLERSVCEVIDLDILACQTIRHLTSLQDDLSAIVGQSSAVGSRDAVLDGTGCRQAETPCTFRVRCRFSAFTAGMENFSLYCFMNPGRNALPALMSEISASLKLLHETILQSSVSPFHSAFRLA